MPRVEKWKKIESSNMFAHLTVADTEKRADEVAQDVVGKGRSSIVQKKPMKLKLATSVKGPKSVHKYADASDINIVDINGKYFLDHSENTLLRTIWTSRISITIS